MTIDTIHNFIKQVALRKERLGFISDADIDLSLDRASLDAFADYFKGYGFSQNLHDALSTFKVNVSFTSASGGVIALPSDYLHLLGVYTTVSGLRYPVRFYNEDELVFAMNSQVRPPSITNPIAYSNAGAIQLYPEIIQSGSYSYLRRPATPKYAFTVSGRTVTYDSGNSTQLEWNEAYHGNIIMRALVLLGLELDDAGTIQFAELQKQETK